MRFLIVRRDNIGDLVVTLPLIASLREAYPAAYIVALVNSYNQTVLQNNPDLDEVYVYQKAKHGRPGEKLVIWWRTLRQVLALRRQRFDVAILAGSAYSRQAAKFAKLAGVKRIVSYGGAEQGISDVVEPLSQPAHHAEVTHHLLSALGVHAEPGPARIVPDEALLGKARASLAAMPGSGPVIGVHISARKPSQRWPQQRFVELMQRLQQTHGCRFVLFWSPGPADHPAHPGDDEKALAVAAALPDGFPLLPYATAGLSELIAGLAICDLVLCSDGGGMHLAAALGKPIVCLFGDSDATHWHPWKVPYRLLQPASRNVADVGVDEVEQALHCLMQQVLAD